MPDGDFGFYILLWALAVSVFGLVGRCFFAHPRRMSRRGRGEAEHRRG